jgi:Mn-dependent DtxR family transcriptional regulator
MTEKGLFRLFTSSSSFGEGKMEKKILDAMKKAGKPVRPGDVAKMIGADGKEVSKVMKDLKKKGKVTSPKACFYEPA